MFTPHVAAKVLGIGYNLHAGLGAFGDGRHRFEVAGFVDRNTRQIAVSQQFTPIVQRFTGAHEIGHWLLHPDQIILHRDRPLAGVSVGKNDRPQSEREADAFGASYLVPLKVAQAEFSVRFGDIDKFRMNEDAAFGLRASNPRQLLVSSTESLEWEMALASAIRYHGTQHFDSLSEQFQVSNMTMAIRLREIGLRR